jgi:hypothetical protein
MDRAASLGAATRQLALSVMAKDPEAIAFIV